MHFSPQDPWTLMSRTRALGTLVLRDQGTQLLGPLQKGPFWGLIMVTWFEQKPRSRDGLCWKINLFFEVSIYKRRSTSLILIINLKNSIPQLHPTNSSEQSIIILSTIGAKVKSRFMHWKLYRLKFSPQKLTCNLLVHHEYIKATWTQDSTNETTWNKENKMIIPFWIMYHCVLTPLFLVADDFLSDKHWQLPRRQVWNGLIDDMICKKLCYENDLC